MRREARKQPQPVSPEAVDRFESNIERGTARAAWLLKGFSYFFLAEIGGDGFVEQGTRRMQALRWTCKRIPPMAFESSQSMRTRFRRPECREYRQTRACLWRAGLRGCRGNVAELIRAEAESGMASFNWDSCWVATSYWIVKVTAAVRTRVPEVAVMVTSVLSVGVPAFVGVLGSPPPQARQSEMKPSTAGNPMERMLR